MKNVIKFHKKQPKDKYAEHEESVLQTAKDNLQAIREKKFGRIVFIATVMTDEDGNIVTQYNGDIRAFSVIGAFRYMENRILKENAND
jgi:hypothetical protein